MGEGHKDEIVYGINPVREALRSKRRAFELFIAEQAGEQRLARIVALAEEAGVSVRRRQRQDLARLCGSEHHQGVVLRTEAFRYAAFEEILAACREHAGNAGLILLLDGIQDPHNLGALVRTAACAGAQGVIIPRDRAVGVTPAAEKAAAGATATVPIAQVTNVVHAIDELKHAGFWVFGATATAESSLYDQDLTGNVVLVVGSEGEGIRPLVQQHCDVLYAIPLLGGVASLNASVAGGISLFEAVRQRVSSARK